MTANTYPPIEDRYVSLLWAEAEAASQIAALHAELFDPAWDSDAVRTLLIDPCASALIAKIRLRETSLPVPGGFAIGRIAADEAEILSIGVSAPFQRRGIGRRLVAGLSRAVKAAGANRLFLEVATDNVPACAMYADLGFTEVGRRKDYYERRRGTAVDALTLSRELTRTP